jgi:hypothetical protein
MNQLCDFYGVKIYFFSWFVDLHEIAKKSNYTEIIDKLNVVNGSVNNFVSENKINSIPGDSHFDSEGHRIIYEQTYGEIPPDLYVLHKCNNPKCSNLDHLYLGTQKDNMKDRSISGRLRTDKYSNLSQEDFKILASYNISRKDKMKQFNIPEGSIDRIILRARTLLAK